MPRPISAILQSFLLVAFLLWLVCDPQLDHGLTKLLGGIGSLRLWHGVQEGAMTIGWLRVWVIGGVACLAVGCLAVEVAQTIGWRRRQTSVRQLMTTVLMVALWCAILMHHSTIAWQAKKFRTHGHVSALDQLAWSLQSNWPNSDGDIAGLGPFTAYPFDSPSVLLLLTPFPLSGTDTVVCAIERSRAGALRFQLGGKDGGDWLECHYGGSQPTGYTSGLSETRTLERFSHLDDHWYLVRYHNHNGNS